MQAALARLEALESDNTGVEVVDLNDDEYGSTDEEDPGQSVSLQSGANGHAHSYHIIQCPSVNMIYIPFASYSAKHFDGLF